MSAAAQILFNHNKSQDHKAQEKSIQWNQLKNNAGFIILGGCLTIFFIICLSILGYIFIRGFPLAFDWRYLVTPPEGGINDNGGILYPLIGTLFAIFASLLFATPIGIAAGIYLGEYAKVSSPLIKISRFAIQSLAGIPSVIFGLFALAFFVLFLGMKHSLLAASLSMSIMILPFIITTTEESILAIPRNFRDGSFALGATKAETIIKIILPLAIPGILTGIMLAIGRIIAESAILILAAGGSITSIPRFISGEYPFLLPDSGRTLAVHLYYQATTYDSIDRAFATSVILIILILILNSVTFGILNKKMIKKKKFKTK